MYSDGDRTVKVARTQATPQIAFSVIASILRRVAALQYNSLTQGEDKPYIQVDSASLVAMSAVNHATRISMKWADIKVVVRARKSWPHEIQERDYLKGEAPLHVYAPVRCDVSTQLATIAQRWTMVTVVLFTGSNIRLPPNVRHLYVHGHCMPTSVATTHCLRSLHIEQVLLPDNWQTPVGMCSALRECSVSWDNTTRTLDTLLGVDGVQQLEILRLYRCSALIGLDLFSPLQVLEIRHTPMLRRVHMPATAANEPAPELSVVVLYEAASLEYVDLRACAALHCVYIQQVQTLSILQCLVLPESVRELRLDKVPLHLVQGQCLHNLSTLSMSNTCDTGVGVLLRGLATVKHVHLFRCDGLTVCDLLELTTRQANVLESIMVTWKLPLSMGNKTLYQHPGWSDCLPANHDEYRRPRLVSIGVPC
jgi:hypothetical protein